jgi:hypothetical protein
MKGDGVSGACSAYGRGKKYIGWQTWLLRYRCGGDGNVGINHK